jgi:hypothetical protein
MRKLSIIRVTAAEIRLVRNTDGKTKKKEEEIEHKMKKLEFKNK